MWILLVPVILAEILFWSCLGYFAWRALKAARSGYWLQVATFLGLISIPFVFYGYMHRRADAQEAARATEIAALGRAAPPGNYPKLLEVHGHATEFELLIFLDALKFEEVMEFQKPRRGEIYGRLVRLAAGCDGLGVAHLRTWRLQGRFGAPKQRDKDCLVVDWKTVSDDRAAIPAVEYRHGTHSTLLPSGNNWASGAYEVRLRSLGGTQLLGYWERPFITRPGSPGPWGYAYPSNTDPTKYKAPTQLEFLIDSLDIT